MRIVSNFQALLTERGQAEQRRISIAEVARVTGLNEHSLGKFAKNRLREYPPSIIAGLCEYFDCGVERLILLQKTDRPQARYDKSRSIA